MEINTMYITENEFFDIVCLSESIRWEDLPFFYISPQTPTIIIPRPGVLAPDPF